MKDRFLFLDVLRLLAIVLVAYTHLVYCAAYDTALPHIVSSVNLPLFPVGAWCWFENFLVKYLNTNPASLGVALFFMITGFLMPMMMERYSRIQFLINRILRIFPTMIVATGIIGVFLYFSQGIVFRPSAYINSWFLTSYISKTPFITGVLWTLVIEFMFYIICFITGKFNYKKLFILQLIILSTVLTGFWKVFPLCKFLMCILVGTSIYLTLNEQNLLKKYSIILFSVIMYIIAFKLGGYFEHVNNYHYKITTQLTVFLSFFVTMKVFEKINIAEKIKIMIKNLAKPVYPVYLLHCSIGLAFLENLRHINKLGILEIYILDITVIILLSILLHVFVEKPSINLSRKINKMVN